MIKLQQNKLSVSGTSQEDRKNHFLDSSYFKIFDYNIKSFIEQFLDLSKLVTFYNNNNEVDGTWHDLLLKDSTINVLMLKEIDIDFFSENLLNDMYKCKNCIDSKYKKDLIKNITQNCSKIFEDIDKYYLIISKNENHLSSYLKNIIKNNLSNFLNLTNQIKDLLKNNNTSHNFSNIWTSKKTYQKISLDKLIQIFDNEINSLLNILYEIKYKANLEYKKLEINGNIEPHIALILTFQKILSIAEVELNKINKKHLDFYYKNVLNIKKLKPKPYTANVKINLSNNVEEHLLKKGELLTAGKGTNNEEVIYEIVHDTNITSAEIKDVYSIDYDDKNINLIDAKKYFLSSKQNNENKIKESNVGFIFSAEILQINSGNRKVDLIINLKKEGFDKLISNLEDLNLINLDEDNEIINKLDNLFNVSYTSLENWNTADYQETYFDIDKHNIIISFIVNNESPEISALENSDIFENKYPLISCDLNKSFHNIGNIFSNLEINCIKVEVEIINLKELNISNDLGNLNTDIPFQIFGPKPVIGSSFIISNDIISKYLVDDLKINLEWFNLPKNELGFKEYYNEYSGIDNNESFQATISSYANNEWYPNTDKQIINLFSSQDHNPYEDDIKEKTNENQSIATITRINNLDLGLLKINSKSNRNGKIKIELCYPPNCFGHEQYPNIVRINSLKSTKKNILPLPNEPYTPTLKSVSLDIKYSKTFDNSSKNYFFYHKYPFINSEQIFKLKLLPPIHNGSSLFLKLSKKTSTICLEFNLKKDINIDQIDLLFSVYNNNDWIELNNEEILFDSTNNLSSSGCITLNLNRFYNINSLCDNKLHKWINIKCKNSCNFNQLIKSITHNSILIQSKKTQAINDNNLFVEGFLKTKKEINSIEQINQATGGSFVEKEKHYINRVSEKLKHKQRAVSILDYEKILLQEFNDIFLVYGIPNYNKHLNFKPGNITLVLVKKYNKELEKPELFSNTELSKMKLFLQNKKSPNVKLNLINPKYEYIQTKFNVIFKKGINNNLHLKKLNSLIFSFLSPWIDDNNKKISTKNYVNTTQIINFIKKIDFVEKIMNFNLFHIINNEIINLENAHKNNCVVSPKHISSMLVPHDNHIISTINKNEFLDEHGINNLMIDTDLIIEDISTRKTDGISNFIIEKNFKIKDETIEDKNENDKFVIRLSS